MLFLFSRNLITKIDINESRALIYQSFYGFLINLGLGLGLSFSLSNIINQSDLSS